MLTAGEPLKTTLVYRKAKKGLCAPARDGPHSQELLRTNLFWRAIDAENVGLSYGSEVTVPHDSLTTASIIISDQKL